MRKATRIPSVAAVLTALLLAVAGAPSASALAQDAALADAAAPHGTASATLLRVIMALAVAQMRAGAIDRATHLRRRALKIAIAAYGCGSGRAAAAMADLARIEIVRERYLDAEPLLIIADRVLSVDGHAAPSRIAAVETGLAKVALARGDTDAALSWARRATHRAAADRQGSAAPLRVLGAVLARQGNFAEAERVLNQALSRDRARHGDDGLEMARSLAQLGNLHLRENRPEAALPLLEEAAAIDQARLGPNHPFIADDLHDIGVAYQALHRDDAARLILRQALAILDRSGMTGTPRVAYVEIELSRIYDRIGQSRAARAAFKDAQDILNKAGIAARRRERQV
jgi:tetratricopeptide (TPR) repeat protein